MSTLPSIRSSFLRLCNSSTKALPPPKAILQLAQPTKKTSNYVGKYFTTTAIAGGFGGAIIGHWSGEMENKHPNRRHLYSESEKKINSAIYTVAGSFFGFFSGPTVFPCALFFGAYLLACKAKIFD